jgi:hypothetical protein
MTNAILSLGDDVIQIFKLVYGSKTDLLRNC